MVKYVEKNEAGGDA